MTDPSSQRAPLGAPSEQESARSRAWLGRQPLPDSYRVEQKRAATTGCPARRESETVTDGGTHGHGARRAT